MKAETRRITEMTTPKSVLITGGCGFIGHHLALALNRMRWKVIVYDSMNYAYKMPAYQTFIEMRLKKLAAAHIPVIQGDTRDVKALGELLSLHQPEKVVHLAAIASAEICNDDPKFGFEVNLQATQIFLELLRRQPGIEQVVFSSSSMVYGHFHGKPMTEDSPTQPIGLYGALKLSSEYIIKAYHNVFGLPYTIIRPSALYGPTCINRRVSQVFIENAILNRKLYLEGGGINILDFTYINDLIQGLVLVLTRQEALNETFNLTYGSAHKIMDLVDLIRERYPDVEFEKRPRKKTIPRRGTLSIEKARTLLGYTPVYPLERGYPLYMDWYDVIGFKESAVEETVLRPKALYVNLNNGGRNFS